MADNESAHEATIVDGGVVVSEVDPGIVEESLQDPTSPINTLLDPRVRRAVANWAEDVQGTSRLRKNSLWARDKYVTPGKVFDQMALAYDALDDDMIGQFMETSEGILFQKMKFENEDEDQQDIWNQIARDLNLDNFIRQAWRELTLVSQYYGIRFMGRRTITPRGKGEKGERARRKKYNLIVPIGLGFLDPTRVVPVSLDPFGNYQLAWIANSNDKSIYNSDEEDPPVQPDEVVEKLFLGKYTPTPQEEAAFGREDIPVDDLMLLNPAMTWRHSLTSSTYDRWARLRMKSIFPLLDIKHQLREMDRAFLLGGTNFIVLITKGSDEYPAKVQEVEAMHTQVRSQSRSPVIVSDHRVNIELISPDIQHILSPEKWKVIDDRILLRLWGGFTSTADSGNRDDSLTRGRLITLGLNSRRHMIKRDLERNIVNFTRDLNEEDMDDDTELLFEPRRLGIDFDPAIASSIQELRDRGDLSRETILTEFDYDQGLEAKRRKKEADEYDKLFEPVNVPFDSPAKTTPSGSGKKGGRPAKPGGGSGNG